MIDKKKTDAVGRNYQSRHRQTVRVKVGVWTCPGFVER